MLKNIEGLFMIFLDRILLEKRMKLQANNVGIFKGSNSFSQWPCFALASFYFCPGNAVLVNRHDSRG